MSRRTVPKGEFRNTQHGACLMRRRAVPEAHHTAVHSTKDHA